MINTPRFLFLCILWWLAGMVCAQGPAPTQGSASRQAHNKRDITHRSNAELRELLMQEAVNDAIDRVAPIEVRSVTKHQVGERRRDKRSTFKENFQQKSSQRTNVRWLRTSAYDFQQNVPRKGWWTCTVQGTVQPMDGGMSSPLSIVEAESFIVDSRKGAQVRVELMNPPKGIDVGERLESFSERGKRTGQAVVTAMDADGFSARILRGRWSVRPGDQMEQGTFPLLSGGFRVRGGTNAPWPYRPAGTASDQANESIVVQGLIFEFYERSLLKQWELHGGVELMRTNDSIAANVFTLYVGAARPITLIPEFLQLVPSIDIGMVLSGGTVSLGALPVFAVGSLEAQFQLGAVELSGGVRYRAMLTDSPFAGPMVTVGIGLDLYRVLGKDTGDRYQPGLSLQSVKDMLKP